MIRKLSIKNYALIDTLEIAFDKGLNIITGETGSGKSILLGALGLLLGDRADSAAVGKDSKKCVIEGEFDLDVEKFKSRFESFDLDFEPNTIIRREILSGGKSRAFVNDTPVKLSDLKELGRELVDIHSQHQTIQINDPAFQLEMLDTYAEVSDMKENYSDAYKAFQDIESELKEAEASLQSTLKEKDFIGFQVKELVDAQLDKWRDEDIEDEYNKLANAEDIRLSLSAAAELLDQKDDSAVALVGLSANKLEQLSELGNDFKLLHNRLNSVSIELKDITAEIEDMTESVNQDPERLNKLENIRNIVFGLERKHGVQGVIGLLDLRDSLEGKLHSTEELEQQIIDLTASRDGALSKVWSLGEKLSKARQKKSKPFCESIAEVLHLLNMNHAQLGTAFSKLTTPSLLGIDGFELLFSANLGHSLSPLKKIASGGEMSRVILAVKKISAMRTGRVSMVFDEIDTGVSGEVAHAMGNIISEMSSRSQIICITHLPQIASKGKAHYKVFKDERVGKVQTSMLKLTGDDRIVEIAQLLSGARTTDAALANARELLHLN